MKTEDAKRCGRELSPRLMATRLDTAIVRGEIDNTEQGRTHGLIWLLGRAEPLRLDLEGDAWRDVAGTRITFHHAAPKRQRCVTELSAVQCGIVGDITASRKVKNITASDEEINRLLEADLPLPFEWQNSLYIEWFSEADGRVIIELAGCEVQITDFAWQMDEAEEQAQQFANMNAMRNWLETIIQRPESTAQPEEDAESGISFGEDSDDDDAEAESVEPMSEESWEASLKHSDRLTEAHMEAIDKYSEDDDSEEKIAFVMGWDHLLDMMAFESEQDGPADQAGGFLVADENEDDDSENEDWKYDEDDSWIEADAALPGLSDQEADEDDAHDLALELDLEDDDDKPHEHPLKRRARNLMLRIMKDLREERRDEAELQGEDDAPGESPLDRFISNTMSISGKLAGVLAGSKWAQPYEAGHTLAILKRCLNWSNESLAGLNDLLGDKHWEDRHLLFSEYKRELHAIRDEITDLRREIRDQNPGV